MNHLSKNSVHLHLCWNVSNTYSRTSVTTMSHRRTFMSKPGRTQGEAEWVRYLGMNVLSYYSTASFFHCVGPLGLLTTLHHAILAVKRYINETVSLKKGLKNARIPLHWLFDFMNVLSLKWLGKSTVKCSVSMSLLLWIWIRFSNITILASSCYTIL